MGQPAVVEKRSSPRRHLTKLLPGSILYSNQKVLQCKPIDISQGGLAIVSETHLPVGSPLFLHTHEEVVALEVVWQKPDFGKKGLHRYGLKTLDPAIDLENIFRNNGCLKNG